MQPRYSSSDEEKAVPKAATDESSCHALIACKVCTISCVMSRQARRDAPASAAQRLPK